MSHTLGWIASCIAGDLTGDPETIITDAAGLTHARSGEITFVTSGKHLAALDRSNASAAVIGADLDYSGRAVIRVEDPLASFIEVVKFFRPPPEKGNAGLHAHCVIHPSAEVAEGVSIAAGATVGPAVQIGTGSVVHSGAHIMSSCRIGEHVTIYPGAVLYENTVVGDRCVLHANCSIGAFGFGYESSGGSHHRTAQLGNVVIGNDVEIGALSAVDRGTFGPTLIGEGTKIDNQVMIAHNCRIGRHNLICAQVGIAGSTTTGEYVVMGGQVGIKDHIQIGSRVVIGAQSGVMHDLKSDRSYLGSPATLSQDQLRVIASLAQLPGIRRKLTEVLNKMESSPNQHPHAEKSGD